MLRNILCIAMRKKIDTLIYEFDNLLRGYQILRENIYEKEVPVMQHASCSVSDFHSLMLSFQTLLENTCEKDFLNYVKNEDDVRSKYIEMSNEHESLKAAYQSASQNMLSLDSKFKEISNERDMLISMFNELKEMLLAGSFKKLSNDTIRKISSMIESIQKSTSTYRLSHHFLQDTTVDNDYTDLPSQTKRPVHQYLNETSSPDLCRTEVFVPSSPRVHTPELLVPDITDLRDRGASNSDSDQVNVTGDVQIITVTWDEMTDKSSDAVSSKSVDHSGSIPCINIDDTDSDPDLDYLKKSPIITEIGVPLNQKSHFQVLKCDICDRNYSRRDSLLRHKVIHSGRKPYACSNCPAKFVQSSHLKRHQMIHINARPYECPICHRTFNHRDNRERHLKNHYTKNTYTCAYCKKNYRSKTNLTMHITSNACLKSN